MNLDDETYLSAYLDDELDPADRLAAEWSIESSPQLAEQLRSLGMARDAVAGLDRPAIPRDLAPALGARLAANRRKARLRRLAQPARIAMLFSSFTVMAASLIFAIILLHHSLHENFGQPKNEANPPLADTNRTHPVAPSNPAPSASPDSSSEHLASRDQEPKSVPRVSDPVAPSIHPGSVVLTDEIREQGDRRRIAGMLESPNVRRIVIVTDVIDASKRIKDLVDQDARKNPDFGRISICQEIVIDPERAEAAEVYAVPMDEQGRRSFVERLAKLFPDLVEEGEPSPDVLTQLTEVGQVALFRGTEAASLREPPPGLHPFIASRANDSPNHFVNADRGTQDQGRSGENPAASKSESSSLRYVGLHKPELDPDFVGPPAPDRLAPLKPGDPVLLLVWVTRPSRHGSL